MRVFDMSDRLKGLILNTLMFRRYIGERLVQTALDEAIYESVHAVIDRGCTEADGDTVRMRVITLIHQMTGEHAHTVAEAIRDTLNLWFPEDDEKKLNKVKRELAAQFITSDVIKAFYSIDE